MKKLLAIFLLTLSVKADYSYKVIDKFHIHLEETLDIHKLHVHYQGRSKGVGLPKHGSWSITDKATEKKVNKDGTYTLAPKELTFVGIIEVVKKSDHFININGTKVFYKVTPLVNKKKIDIHKFLIKEKKENQNK